MENRGSKAMALAALIVGVVGLTIGFAAFSATLTINSGATVTPDETSQFDSVFGFAKKAATTDGTDEGTPNGSGVVTADYEKVWSGITYDFVNINHEQAEVITYTATVKNDSNYTAYTDNTTQTLGTASCTATTGTTTSLKNEACGQITLKVDAPASIPARSTATVTVTITGPTTAVDGNLTVVFPAVELDYTTADGKGVEA